MERNKCGLTYLQTAQWEPMMPLGDDDELGHYLVESSIPRLDKSVVYRDGLDLRFVDCPNLTCATTLPLYGKGHY